MAAPARTSRGLPFKFHVGAVGSNRGVPDYSFDADPNTGVSVYDSTSCQGFSGWMIFGGTNVSSPSGTLRQIADHVQKKSFLFFAISAVFAVSSDRVLSVK